MGQPWARPGSTPTDRELEVLAAYIAAGSEGVDGAAAALQRSRYTILNHLANLRLRLGVETTAQAIVELMRRGAFS